MRLCSLLLVTMLLSGCATSLLNGTVIRFHGLHETPQSFAIVPESTQEGSLEFRAYAGMVAEKLRTRGWHETDPSSADVAVFLQYQISQGRQVTFSYPVFGAVPTGTSTTSGTVSTYGNTSTINATTTQQTSLGVVGTGTGNRTEFDRAVRMTMFSLPAYRQTQKMEAVYEGEIRSTGSTGELPTVMPALLDGLFEDFPGKSGTTRTVSVPIR